MMIRKCVLWMVLMAPVLLMAQGQIRGVVIDEMTGEAVIGAHMVVKDSDPIVGALTDIEGRFSIDLTSAAPITLITSFVGYESIETNLEDFTTTITIALPPALMEEVAIVATSDAEVPNEFATVSSRTISIDKADQLPVVSMTWGGWLRTLPGCKKQMTLLMKLW